MGSSINHMSGFWGPVDGADFCEYNYNKTYFAGELYCTITACTNFIIVGIALYQGYRYYLRNDFPKVLLALMALRFINLCAAAGQHMVTKIRSTKKNSQQTYRKYFGEENCSEGQIPICTNSHHVETLINY